METIIGPPGTGKTREIEKEIEGKKDYIYMTYNVNMAESARERIENSRRIGTFHSILSQLMGLSNFLNEKDLKEFMDRYRLKYPDYKRFERWYTRTVYGMEKPVNPLGEKLNMPYLYEKYNAYKEETGKIDYSDIIKLGTEARLESEYLYIDEAQDLTPLMWRVVDNFNAEKVIAGDPHQSINSHTGVKVEEFIKRMDNVRTLKKSYRFGDNLRKLADHALSNGRIMDVEYTGIGETEIQKHDLNGFLKLEGTKAVLCRSNALAVNVASDLNAIALSVNPDHSYQLGWSDRVLRLASIIQKYPRINEAERKYIKKYSSAFNGNQMPLESFRESWDYGLKLPEKERDNVIRAVRERLPEVFVDTIHATKGLEFDHVYVFLDLPQPYMFSLEEKRIIYTGLTRARKSLDYGYRGFYAEKYSI